MAMPADGRPARIVLARSALRVLGFWWLATGLIVALQRNRWTSLLALVLASLGALAGLRLLFGSRAERTPRSAQVAFVGASLLWLWIQTLFYAGLVVGPSEGISVPGPGPSLGNALLAIRATAYNEALALGALALALAIQIRNPVGWQTLFAFWAADSVAKLNVFLGVANAAAHFLPEHLYFLMGFFGPGGNTPFLFLSIALLAGLTAFLLRRTATATDTFVREGASLLAVLLGLAALEHLLLAIPAQVPLWDLFLRARDG